MSSYQATPRDRTISEASYAGSSTPTVTPSRPGALATLVSGSWGFGRRKRDEASTSTFTAGKSEDPDTRDVPEGDAKASSASDALRRFQF